MLSRIRKAQKNDEGFTLIELLIVIVILGILAAIVVFAIGSTRGDAVTNACKNAFKQVELSAEAVKTKSGSYPAVDTATTGSNDTTQSGVNIKYAALRAGTNGGLLKEYPFSKDYSLVYAQVAAVTGPPAVPANYTITVGKRTSSTDPAIVALTAAQNPTSKEGCDNVN